jgi:hypothetical protein
MTDEERCPQCMGRRGMPRIRFDVEPQVECDDPFHKTEPPASASAPIEFPGPADAVTTKSAEPGPTKEDVAPDLAPGHLPVCPHCNREGKITGATTGLGPYKVMVIRCGYSDCRKILGAFQPLDIQMVPMGGPGMPPLPPPPGGRIQ